MRRRNSRSDRVERRGRHFPGLCQKDRKYGTGAAENNIPKRSPQAIAEMIPKFNCDAAQHQQPENYNQRQIKAAEAGRVKAGKGKVEGSTGGQEERQVSRHFADAENEGINDREFAVLRRLAQMHLSAMCELAQVGGRQLPAGPQRLACLPK
jgi:hypothetical protein